MAARMRNGSLAREERNSAAAPENVVAIVSGNPITRDYHSLLTALIGDTSNIIGRFGWLPDDQLKLWLCAA